MSRHNIDQELNMYKRGPDDRVIFNDPSLLHDPEIKLVPRFDGGFHVLVGWTDGNGTFRVCKIQVVVSGRKGAVHRMSAKLLKWYRDYCDRSVNATLWPLQKGFPR